MSNDNFVLTQNAIKRHAKRLQTQMQSFNQELSLGQSQTLLSKILGFNDWNHLLTVYKNETPEDDLSQLNISLTVSVDTNNEFYQFVIRHAEIKDEDKDLFIGSYEYLCNYKEEIIIGKEVYRNKNKLEKEKSNNNRLIIRYLSDCIDTDDLPLFIKKSSHIKTYYDDSLLFSEICNSEQFKIAQYIIDHSETKNVAAKILDSLSAAGFYCKIDRVKFLYTHYDIIIRPNILYMACFQENIEILSYIIEQYKIKNPQITDFTSLIMEGITMCHERGNIKNFKLLMSLPNTVFNDKDYLYQFIDKLIYHSYPYKKNYHKYNKSGRLAILSYLLQHFKPTKEIISLLNNAPYYKKALNKI